MKKFNVFAITLITLLAFGLAFTACDSGSGGGGGGNIEGSTNIANTTWISMGGLLEVSFTASNFTMKAFGMLVASGPYKVEGKTISCTYTSIGPGAEDTDVIGRVVKFEAINENTLYYNETDGEYYFTKVK